MDAVTARVMPAHTSVVVAVASTDAVGSYVKPSDVTAELAVEPEETVPDVASIDHAIPATSGASVAVTDVATPTESSGCE
jgi:hypothetical protein